MPRPNPFRPDFMATGPHAVVTRDKPVVFQGAAGRMDDDDEGDGPKYEFYESDKLLGKLFRAVDEREIFSNIQEGSSHAKGGAEKPRQSILRRLWAHVQQHCQGFEWKHHLDRARAIRDEYVNSFFPFFLKQHH